MEKVILVSILTSIITILLYNYFTKKTEILPTTQHNMMYGSASTPSDTSKLTNFLVSDDQGNISTFIIPSGTIVSYKGEVNTIPLGWALCDGTKNTPDLRGRFIMGVNTCDNSSKVCENGLLNTSNQKSGGIDMKTLSVEEMPSHKHSMSAGQTGRTVGYGTDNWPTWSNYGNGTGVMNAVAMDNVGGGKPFDMRPPFYSLLYIMKV
jgi:microcystin-dependent protein